MFPVLTDEDIRESELRAICRLSPVTVCECGEVAFIHRLGCRCGNFVGKGAAHAFLHNGDILYEGKDFSLLPNLDSGE